MAPEPTTLFREAMARLPAAVHVITTKGPAGTHGTTATALTSLSDAPPSLLVCINRQARLHDILHENGSFCANLLAGPQADVAAAFANGALDPAARFAATGPWGETVLDGHCYLGHPGAQSRLACRVERAIAHATHTLFIGAVVAIELAEPGAEPALLYHRRAFTRLPA